MVQRALWRARWAGRRNHGPLGRWFAVHWAQAPAGLSLFITRGAEILTLDPIETGSPGATTSLLSVLPVGAEAWLASVLREQDLLRPGESAVPVRVEALPVEWQAASLVGAVLEPGQEMEPELLLPEEWAVPVQETERDWLQPEEREVPVLVE